MLLNRAFSERPRTESRAPNHHQLCTRPQRKAQLAQPGRCHGREPRTSIAKPDRTIRIKRPKRPPLPRLSPTGNAVRVSTAGAAARPRTPNTTRRRGTTPTESDSAASPASRREPANPRQPSGLQPGLEPAATYPPAAAGGMRSAADSEPQWQPEEGRSRARGSLRKGNPSGSLRKGDPSGSQRKGDPSGTVSRAARGGPEKSRRAAGGGLPRFGATARALR